LIKVVNPKDVLIVIKNEVLIDPPNLTIIYIKEQYEKEAKLSELLDEDKLKILHGSEADFYELINKYQDMSLDRIFLIYTIDEFESLENLMFLINKKMRKSGQIIITLVQENISNYSAKHFLDRNKIASKSIKLIEKRYKKYLSKIAFFQYFEIEAPFVLDERYNFYKYLILMEKYKIKKFIDINFILKLFYNNDFTIMKDDRNLNLIKLRKNY
jgi:hypothetical protein